jgi:two-component system, NtrC family, sensor kinase
MKRKMPGQGSRRRADPGAVQELARSLIRVVDPDALLRSVGEGLRKLFGTDLILILVADPQGPEFTPWHSIGFAPEALRGVGFSSRGRMAGWLSANQQCLSLAGGARLAGELDPVDRELVGRLEVQICAPLVSLDRLIGMILLGASDPGWALDGDELELLAMLASQVALALEHAMLHAQRKERLHRLYLAERLATAGQLAAAVAHEIRNPLAVISTTVEYLVRDFPEGDAKRSLAQQLLSEVSRIKQTTEALTSLGREREPQRSELDILEILDQALLLIEVQRQQQRVEVVKSYGQARLPVLGGSNEFRQVFLNLLLNSLQAMGDGGKLSIRAGVRTSPYDPETDRRVRIEITDTGCGLRREDLERVFDPFFTTKPQGTGLGLFICQSILARYDGEIRLESAVGRGTTARIDLPLLT